MSGTRDNDTPAEPGALPEAALRVLVEQSGELICSSDRDGRIVWANPSFRAATGGGPGCRLDELVAAGDEGAPAREAIADGLREASHAATGLAWRAADGSALWLDARVRRHGAQWLWSFADVTALRFLAAQASRHGELLDTAQEFGRLGLWERRIPSGEGRWDRHVFRFWGLDPSIGTPEFQDAIQHIHPEDRVRMNYLESTRQAGRYAQRYRVIHPDGQVRRIHSQWEVKNGPDGKPDRAVGIMMDDTEVYDEASALGNIGSQLKLAVELGQIAIWRHDLGTQLMHYNDRASAVLGIPERPEGVSIDAVRKTIHSDDLPLVLASAARALASDAPTDMEARYRRADGVWRTVMTRRVVERDADGKAVAFVGVALDVTETVEQRRRAEELARRLDAASRAAGIGIWTTTLGGKDTTWNEQMFELFDRFPPPSAPPSLAAWLEDGVHAEDRDRVGRVAHRFLERGEGPFEIEFRALTRSGALRWVVLRAHAEPSGGERRRLLGVAVDVTEHHVALDALREASQRTHLITRYAGIGTWEAHFDGSCETWDEQMFVLRGLAPRAQALTREERLAIVHPDDVPRVLDSLAGSTTARMPAAYEFRVRLPDGRWRWLASRSAAVADATGQSVRRVGVNWDVTEAKEAESARQQAALAEREIQAKSQFLSRMSHELRTPLNAVLGFTQLLQLEARRANQGAQAAKLGHIRAAGEHLLSLINDVLDLSGLESGELKLTPRTVDLGALLRETVPLVVPLAAQHGVTIEVGGPGGLAHADPTRLRQVLINLLSNAIKYNRRDGRVFVEASVDMRALADGGLIRVRDTGRGLTRSQLARLFEPFNRFGAEREGIEGTGIGLVIVKALVRGMGGTIGVESAPGVGTTIEVRLPPAHEHDAPEPDGAERLAPGNRVAARPAPSAPAERGRILYIEDNAVNVLLVEELVRAAGGLAVASAATGTAGVERARSTRPDLVLIDLQLPDFDGFEVLRRLRADPATRAIRCVALSANAMPDDIERGLAAGFIEYWTKPIDFPAFIAALLRLFPERVAT